MRYIKINQLRKILDKEEAFILDNHACLQIIYSLGFSGNVYKITKKLFKILLDNNIISLRENIYCEPEDADEYSFNREKLREFLDSN